MSWEDAADDEDAWAVNELPADTAAPAAPPTDDGAEWTSAVAAPAPAPAPVVVDDKPLILVNFTKLSNGAIHNKFDPNACNDPEAKSALAKQVSADYERYAKDAALIASGDVRASGSSCWRAALAELRKERPGEFFAPVFPS